jgi:hypothetical protein
MNLFQKEYEAYIKKVTDAFITMNGDNINNSEWHKDTSVFYQVIWNGGIDFSFDLNCSFFGKGITYEEMKKYNFEISKKYLNENTLTYDQWFLKYKNIN